MPVGGRKTLGNRDCQFRRQQTLWRDNRVAAQGSRSRQRSGLSDTLPIMWDIRRFTGLGVICQPARLVAGRVIAVCQIRRSDCASRDGPGRPPLPALPSSRLPESPNTNVFRVNESPPHLPGEHRGRLGVGQAAPPASLRLSVGPKRAWTGCASLIRPCPHRSPSPPRPRRA